MQHFCKNFQRVLIPTYQSQSIERKKCGEITALVLKPYHILYATNLHTDSAHGYITVLNSVQKVWLVTAALCINNKYAHKYAQARGSLLSLSLAWDIPCLWRRNFRQYSTVAVLQKSVFIDRSLPWNLNAYPDSISSTGNSHRRDCMWAVKLVYIPK